MKASGSSKCGHALDAHWTYCMYATLGALVMADFMFLHKIFDSQTVDFSRQRDEPSRHKEQQRTSTALHSATVTPHRKRACKQLFRDNTFKRLHQSKAECEVERARIQCQRLAQWSGDQMDCFLCTDQSGLQSPVGSRVAHCIPQQHSVILSFASSFAKLCQASLNCMHPQVV